MNKIRILDILPLVENEEVRGMLKERDRIRKQLSDRTNGMVELDVVTIDGGAVSIESYFDEAINIPYFLHKLSIAKEYDAVIIDCFGDPGLDAARELLDIPVIGPNHSALHLASQVGGRFSVISVLPQLEHPIRDLARKYGLENNLVSVRNMNIPVLELEKDSEAVEKTVEAAKKAVEEDGACAIVFGCTGMSFFLDEVRETLRNEGILVPVIEPFQAAVYNAVMWVLLGVTHSKTRYVPPREKERIWGGEILWKK